ncbi:MAG TPA: MFS transporter, partial [Patescibacteria group bacterium]|nr:MFS transporter [Patescibacteria group bacterium]
MERTSPSQSDQIDHDYEFSIKKIHPDYRMQYRLLCGYSFIWWGFYSFFVIFQPLYLVHAINLPLWAVFINGAVESIFTIFIQSKWSDAADKTGNLRRYMFIGNLFMAFVALFMLLVQNLFMLFVLSFLYRASPNSDVFATTYIYQISDYIPPESGGTEQDGGSNSRQVYTDSDSRGRPVVLSASQKKYNQINTFAHYRRFGSIGWAIFAPFGGWLCNLFGFIPVFMVCALGFALLSIAILYAVDEGPNFNRNKNQIDRAVRRNLDNLEDYEIKTAEKKESDQELP